MTKLRQRARRLALGAGFLVFLLTETLSGAPHLSPVYRLKSDKQLITRNDFDFQKLESQIEAVAFLAVCTNRWPPGMAPIFAVERTNRIELRRRPLRGQENYSEPLFFGLPLEDELEAGKVAGHWEGVAGRSGGTKDYPAFEWAVEGDQIAGRFDQNTEYRYAYVSGGTFRSNRLELRIDYMNESWFLSGNWSNGTIKGTWRRGDDTEQGPWEATRQAVVLPEGKAIPLYEWRRTSDDARRYGLARESFGPEWQRAARPLCRVWATSDGS